MAGSPLLIAHRGGAGLAPENTLEAFESAVYRWGADMLEMDVRLTKDGEVVVIHDETVDRTTDGSGAVAEMTLEELQELDAGFRFVDEAGGSPFRGRGVRIPRFEDVLNAFPSIRINVETKDGASAPGLVDLILRHGAQERVLVAAEYERNRRAVKGYPGPWGASRSDIVRFLALTHLPWGHRFNLKCDALQVPEAFKGIPILTPAFIQEAHRRNLPIHVWTIDEPTDMKRLLEMGVDGVQTDRPDRLAPILTEMFGRPPAPELRP